MLFYLVISLVLGQLLCPTMAQGNSSETAVSIPMQSSSTTSSSSNNNNHCSKLSANGCCAKGFVRNARGRCVVENCMGGSWNGWLSRPLTMSCYFHWFLLIFAGFIIVLMLALATCNLAFELRKWLFKRQRATTQYLHLSPSSSMSSSVV
ncbi:hypothetical protein KR093_007284 [Drosophila rubida]|uniref:Uncharacterized protein n=1 Tax=Drosophila rubida TaxID=30044 RepID=A0AAD4K7D6_9MUSC|nr:hypothetical protein KR093_007284 [Drosophila rubida]